MFQEVVEALVKKATDVHAQDVDGRNALMFA